MREKETDLFGEGLIINQWDYPVKRGSFGVLGSIRKNGCGSIALHNLLRLLGFESRYWAVLEYFRVHCLSSTVCFGLLGSNPFFIWNYLKKLEKLKFKIYKIRNEKQAEEIPKDHAVYLNMYFYKFGSHYTASVFHDGKMLILNDRSAESYGDYFKKIHAFYMITLGIDKIGG